MIIIGVIVGVAAGWFWRPAWAAELVDAAMKKWREYQGK